MSVRAWLMDPTTAADLMAYREQLRAGGKSNATVQLRLWQLRRMASDTLKPLRSMTAGQLAAYLSAQSWAPATRYSVRATLKDFYAFLVDSGRIDRDPAARLPRIKVNPPAHQPTPDDALQAASEVADARTQLMLELAVRQGLRRCEVAQVHTGRDLVRDPNGWALIVHGKGSKDRMIPLHADLAERLRATGSGWVFPNGVGGHLTANYVGVLMSRALPEGWSAHSLRRRFATRAYDGTHDLRAVQQLLGHSSIATTQVYIGTRPEVLRAALDAADAPAEPQSAPAAPGRLWAVPAAS